MPFVSFLADVGNILQTMIAAHYHHQHIFIQLWMNKDVFRELKYIEEIMFAHIRNTIFQQKDSIFFDN